MKSRCTEPPEAATTLKPLTKLPLWASGLVTVTVRLPNVAPVAMLTLAVSCVADPNVHAVTVMPAPKLHVAPLTKFVPVTITTRLCPGLPVVGLTPVTVGAGAGTNVVTVKALARLPLWASGLVTVTVRVPSVAPVAMLTLAVSCVADPNVHAVTVMPAPKLHVAPLTKFVPVTATVRLCPWLPELGLTPVTNGGNGAPGRTISTHAKSATGVVPARFAPTWIPSRGLANVTVVLPTVVQVAPSLVE